MIKTDEEKAEEYIIAKYKLNECYIEDTEETRVYMRNNVHSEYQQEYECYLAGLEAGREEAKKQWHDCFLSCSSPYCAEHFPAVKFEGELGNMTKCEVENAESN